METILELRDLLKLNKESTVPMMFLTISMNLISSGNSSINFDFCIKALVSMVVAD